jgi:hypothetical protein
MALTGTYFEATKAETLIDLVVAYLDANPENEVVSVSHSSDSNNMKRFTAMVFLRSYE